MPKRKHAGSGNGRFAKFRRGVATAIGVGRKALPYVKKGIKTAWKVKKVVDKVRSHTKTNSKAVIQSDDLHTGLSRGVAKFSVFPNCLKKIIPKSLIDYYYTDAYNVKGIAGIQSGSSANAISTVSQWLTSTALPPNGTQSNVRFFDFNPAQKLTGSAFITGSIPANDRLCLFSSESYFDFVNLETIGATVRFYAFTCIKDTDFDPAALWSSIIGNEAMGPVQQAVPGAGVANGTAAGYLNPAMPYSAPIDIPDFKKIWKCKMLKDFDLAPGAVRQIKVHVQHNDIAVQTVIITQSGKTQFRKGTVYFYYTVVGCPVADITNAGTTGSVVTYGSVDVGLAVRTKLRFKSVKAGPNRLQATYGQFGTQATTTLANQKAINMLDAAAAVIQAL